MIGGNILEVKTLFCNLQTYQNKFAANE